MYVCDIYIRIYVYVLYLHIHIYIIQLFDYCSTQYAIHIGYVLPLLWSIPTMGDMWYKSFVYLVFPSYLEYSLLFNMNYVCKESPGTPDVNSTDAEGNSTTCKKCNISRPLRAHHCSQCRKCILNYDHHCPFVANCVGLYNRRNFVLLLFFAAITSLYAVYVTRECYLTCRNAAVSLCIFYICTLQFLFASQSSYYHNMLSAQKHSVTLMS